MTLASIEAERLSVAQDGVAWLQQFRGVRASIVDLGLKVAIRVGGGQPLATALAELHEFAVERRHIHGAGYIIRAIEKLDDETPAAPEPKRSECAECGTTVGVTGSGGQALCRTCASTEIEGYRS